MTGCRPAAGTARAASIPAFPPFVAARLLARRAALCSAHPFLQGAAVFASLSLLLRHLLAWAAALFVAGMVWSGIFSGMNDGPGWIFGLLAMFLIISALGSAITHIRRVWLVAGRPDATTLSGASAARSNCRWTPATRSR